MPRPLTMSKPVQVRLQLDLFAVLQDQSEREGMTLGLLCQDILHEAARQLVEDRKPKRPVKKA